MGVTAGSVDARGRGRASERRSPGEDHQPTVVLCDDDVTIRKLYRRALRSFDVDLVDAVDAEACLARVAELRARVEAVLRRAGGTGANEPVRRFGDLVVDLADVHVVLDGTPLRLTKTEYALLEAFVTNPGKLLTHWWLLDRVWGRGIGDEGRQYLRVYTGQLRAKLGDDATAPRFILTEPGVGYRWIAPPG